MIKMNELTTAEKINRSFAELGKCGISLKEAGERLKASLEELKKQDIKPKSKFHK